VPRVHLPNPPYAIVGLGLVGGSLARAVRARTGKAVELMGIDPDSATRRQALAEGVVDVALPRVGKALSGCGLVVIATPFGALARVLAELASVLAPEALITDVVGLKAEVAHNVQARLPGARYVGSHPMAGGEHGGFAHSHRDLFVERTVVVCPGRLAADTRRISALWRLVGAKVALMTPKEHDQTVAVTSHLPYLAALGLVRVAERRERGSHIAGRGFADATRRVDFDPEVMATVVGHNPHVPRALRALARELSRMARAVSRDPDVLVAEAEHARALHRQLLRATPSTSAIRG
jgi:prephenate dehydrogenase